MSSYPFDIIKAEERGLQSDPQLLAERPFAAVDHSFANEARYFEPGEELVTAINTAVALGEPLLITGEPGTGKTQAAYYAAYKLGIEPVIHFQVKSDTTAHDLLYHFDAVRYFFDASLKQLDAGGSKDRYIEKRELWEAFAEGEKHNAPRVLLIDEIDKAPRDFPNDLLLELDKMQFKIKEKEQDNIVRAPVRLRPIVFITSNSERRLPEPFLRRCLYHHIVFDDRIVRRAVDNRKEEFKGFSGNFLELAIRRFLDLRNQELRKKPATGELLVWLRVLKLNYPKVKQQLAGRLADTPFIGALLKDHQDLEDIKRIG